MNARSCSLFCINGLSGCALFSIYTAGLVFQPEMDVFSEYLKCELNWGFKLALVWYITILGFWKFIFFNELMIDYIRMVIMIMIINSLLCLAKIIVSVSHFGQISQYFLPYSHDTRIEWTWSSTVTHKIV